MFQIRITGLSNERFTLDLGANKNVLANISVLELKEKIINEKNVNLAVQEMRLLFAGKQLEDEKMLCDYKIENNSILWVVVRLHGGINFLF